MGVNTSCTRRQVQDSNHSFRVTTAIPDYWRSSSLLRKALGADLQTKFECNKWSCMYKKQFPTFWIFKMSCVNVVPLAALTFTSTSSARKAIPNSKVESCSGKKNQPPHPNSRSKVPHSHSLDNYYTYFMLHTNSHCTAICNVTLHFWKLNHTQGDN